MATHGGVTWYKPHPIGILTMNDTIDIFSFSDDCLARMPKELTDKRRETIQRAIDAEITARLVNPEPIDIDGMGEHFAEDLSGMGHMDRMVWLRGFLDRLSADAILDLDGEMFRR